TKNRVSLWLRSERAFGLESVAIGVQAESQTEAQVVETRSDETPTAATALFSDAPSVTLMPPPSVEPLDAPLLSTDEKKRRLIAMDNNEVRACTRCRLCETRKNT